MHQVIQGNRTKNNHGTLNRNLIPVFRRLSFLFLWLFCWVKTRLLLLRLPRPFCCLRRKALVSAKHPGCLLSGVQVESKCPVLELALVRNSLFLSGPRPGSRAHSGRQKIKHSFKSICHRGLFLKAPHAKDITTFDLSPRYDKSE